MGLGRRSSMDTLPLFRDFKVISVYTSRSLCSLPPLARRHPHALSFPFSFRSVCLCDPYTFNPMQLFNRKFLTREALPLYCPGFTIDLFQVGSLAASVSYSRTRYSRDHHYCGTWRKLHFISVINFNMPLVKRAATSMDSLAGAGVTLPVKHILTGSRKSL
jgi:hypothetical protein